MKLLYGCVMGTPDLLERARDHADRVAGGYLASPGAAPDFFRPLMLGDDADLLGAMALALARRGAERQRR